MKTNTSCINEPQAREVCTYPELGELLLDYIVDLLEESVAEEVEDHLLDCAYCEERYQTILNIRSASRRKTRGAEGEQVLQPERAAGGAKVLKLAEFRKRLH